MGKKVKSKKWMRKKEMFSQTVLSPKQVPARQNLNFF
jgi:hypothetical protein